MAKLYNLPYLCAKLLNISRMQSVKKKKKKRKNEFNWTFCTDIWYIRIAEDKYLKKSDRNKNQNKI